MHALLRNCWSHDVAGIMLMIAAASTAPAINITVQYDPTQPGAVMPAFDPNGTQLMAIAGYVATFYENVFEDAGHSPTFTFWYADLSDGLLGDHDNVTLDRHNREIAGNIKIDTQNAAGVARNYFFDPTPATNSEFNMTQLLWRDLPVPNRNDWYIGASGVPQTFETSFTGTAPSGSPAAGASDMLSLIFHEMGHALGMSSGIPLTVTETSDGDYDFNSAFLFGGTLAADCRDQASDFVGHLDDASNLMFPNLSIPGSGGSAGVRKLPSHADLFAMAAGHNYTTLDVPRREFYNPSGDWNTDSNWSGNNTPDNADDAFVRNGATATLSAFGAAGNLNVLEGALVSTQDHTLFVQNRTTVAGTPGSESQITINTGGQLDSDALVINGGGRVVLVSTALLESENITIAEGGELRGFGTVSINSDLGELTSDGLIRATNNGELAFTSPNNLALNLDGEIEAIDGDIRLKTGMGTPLAGTMTVGAGREVTLEHGGDVGAGGLIVLKGTEENVATISGLPLRVSLNGVISADGVGVIENTLLLATGGILETHADEPHAELRLAGSTLFQGGSIRGNGRVRQIGNATVEQDTEITIDIYDMDGIKEETEIVINLGLLFSIVSTTIEPTANDGFDGTIINRGTLSVVAGWRLDGELRTEQNGATVPSLAGSNTFRIHTTGAYSTDGDSMIVAPLEVAGAMVIDGGATRVDNMAAFEPTAEVFVEQGAELALDGPTILNGGDFAGDGLLQFNATTTVTSDTTIATGRVDLDGNTEGTMVLLNNAALALNVSDIGATDSLFDGTIQATGESARLEVNLNNQAVDWTITNSGILNLTTPAPADNPTLMLDGSDVSVEGRINATGHLRLSANIALHGHLQTTTDTTDVHFASGGPNLVFNTAIIEGEGRLTIDRGTSMHLEDNSNIDVDVENAGRLEAGFRANEVGVDFTAAATATIRGDYAQGSTGTLGVELGAPGQADGFDVLNITGTAHLGGTLELELAGGFLPQAGSTFQILTAQAVIGTFDSLVALDAGNRFGLDVSVLYSAIDAVVRIDDVVLSGDYDSSGSVDAADYALWRDTLGESGIDLAADGNRDELINQADYEVWRAHFGNSLEVGAATQAVQTVARSANPPRLGGPASVPEPPIIALACIALTAIVGRGRIRHDLA